MSIYALRYHAIVMNAPYIFPPTKEAREAYRARYVSAHMKFGMGAPFIERMFELAVEGGFTGQITGNAFMKREYGQPLVEKVLPYYDLTDVIDTSGAYIPGHGTPTVILFARNRPPSSDTIRVVMGRRGEPKTPEGAQTPSAGLLPLLKPILRAVDEDLAREHPALDKAMRERITAAWVLTACMVEDFEARLRLYERERFPRGLEGDLGDACERVAELFPATAWFDHEAGVNIAFTARLSRAGSDRLRASLATLPSKAHELRGGCGALAGKLWPHTDSQWMGDLHQLLDAWAVKEHAFCQTPRFVADFILDRTLTPAVKEFGLDGLRVLDPTCGAGHFLVNAFWRLFAMRASPEDGLHEHTHASAARLALGSIFGGDLNPAVAALAEYRLALAYLDATQPRTLASLPWDLHELIHIEVADALLAERPVGRRRPAWADSLDPQKAPAHTPAPTMPTPPPTRPQVAPAPKQEPAPRAARAFEQLQLL
jgi:hypothetical protein